MKVLVLGASGHIGKRLVEMLAATSWAAPVRAERKDTVFPGDRLAALHVNLWDAKKLTEALTGFDAVVNCVTCHTNSISTGAEVLVRAAIAAGCRRIVHLSTMSVYGATEGRVSEHQSVPESTSSAAGGYSRYGWAKCLAERHMAEFSRQGGELVTLRLGHVYGPGSEQWVGRVARLLKSRRLGDLGIAGDGWSNLVHVDDVCRAIVASLRLPLGTPDTPDMADMAVTRGRGQHRTFNLAAPDSPRWNDYFVDLALAIGAVPVRRVSRAQLWLDSSLYSPVLKVAQWLTSWRGKRHGVHDPLSKDDLRLSGQLIQLDAALATSQLSQTWTPYSTGLQSSVDWFLAGQISAYVKPVVPAVLTMLTMLTVFTVPVAAAYVPEVDLQLAVAELLYGRGG